MADALVRLQVRYPVPGAREHNIACLFTALDAGHAVVRHVQPGDYPRPHQMGHDYLSNETHLVAASFGSDLAARETVARVGGAASAVRKALGSQARRLSVDLHMVDWSEVAAECAPQADAVAPEQGVAAAGPRADASGGAVLDLLQGGAGRKIDPDVLAILRQCTTSGLHVHLPDIRLSRALYAKVNEVLVALGGKWVGRKVQAHEFDQDPAAVLDVAVGTGTFVKPQDFGYFPTPAAVVDRLMRLARLEPGMKVLEPEAGTGAIALAAAQIVGFDLVTPIELLPGNARKLREAGFSFVNQVDFLTVDPIPIFDRVLMNPPFAGMADVAHVMHATRFLKPDGLLVAITSPSWSHNTSRKAAAFRDFVEECEGEVEEVERGAFRESGTDVTTRLVVLEAEKMPWNQRRYERQRA